MLLRMLIGVMILGSLAGCATTQGPSNTSQLQIRVAQLEQQLEQRDQDIIELKYTVEELSTDLESAKRSAKFVREVPTTTTSSTAAVSLKTQEILRVPVTPQEVQRALKSAGHYDGAIDGNLGSGSQRAIKAFQKEHNLESDGVVGKKTWEELKTYLD